jgi:hypothetical protein
MPQPRHHALRRLAVLVLGIAVALVAEVALSASSVAPGTATALAESAQAGTTTTYDRTVHATDCALLGRAFNEGLGCARERCVAGAVPWRTFAGAEACALAGQPQGYGYGATVGARQCSALHRRWIAAVNYCASEPDRSLALVRDAPQCAAPASIYVTLSESEGAYDECLTPARARTLAVAAAMHGTTLAGELARRQPEAASSGRGGVLVVGDSITWRGSDELSRERPAFVVDAEPARRPSELRARLDAFRARHGQPTGLVIELGTNAAPGFDRADLAAAVRSVPAATPVMLVLPYLETGASAPATFAGWMRSVAAERKGSCVADWPAYVRSHPAVLQDGIHPRNDAEGDWARWLSAEWDRCS